MGCGVSLVAVHVGLSMSIVEQSMLPPLFHPGCQS